MSETRRRSKPESVGEDLDGQQPPRRQTRVTLTKDVSSKYRKIMPKTSATGEKAPASRYKKTGADNGPAPRPRRGGDGPASRNRRDGDGPSPRRRESADSSAPPPFKPGFKSRSAVTSRGPAATSRTPGKPDSGVALKAIINRELPEAARQVRETQELILNSANEMLTLTEMLEGIHRQLDEAVAEVLDENKQLKELLTPLRGEMSKAQKVVVGLYEKMSFQDLAGQRLTKVEHFLTALKKVLGDIGRPAGRTYTSKPPLAKPGRERKAPPRKAAPSKLKGPQAAGKGLAQDAVDRLASKP